MKYLICNQQGNKTLTNIGFKTIEKAQDFIKEKVKFWSHILDMNKDIPSHHLRGWLNCKIQQFDFLTNTMYDLPYIYTNSVKGVSPKEAIGRNCGKIDSIVLQRRVEMKISNQSKIKLFSNG